MQDHGPCEGQQLLARAVPLEGMSLVDGVPELVGPGVTVVLVEVEAPEARALLAAPVQQVLVERPLGDVGVGPTNRDADHLSSSAGTLSKN